MSKKSEKDKANDYDAHLDKTLIDGASDSNYMYSIADTHAILLKLRQKYLNYDGIQEANPGEAYSYLRENNNQVLLLNSYVLQDLRNGLADDISKITEGGQGVAVWNHPPQTILVPFLTAAHWILMKVDIDYVECKASLLWDNPYGSSYEVGEYVLNGVSITSLGIIRYVHAFVERIIQHYSHDPSFVLQENDWVLNYQHMDQQGFQRDGVSCGIITLRNIEDYLDARINHGKSVPEEYTIPSYFDNLKINREKLLQAKEAHVTYFVEISGEKANNGEVRVFSEISGTSIKDFLDVDKVISEIENLRVSYNRTNPMITKGIGAQNKSKDLDYTQKAQGYSSATREIGLNAIYNETQILKIWDNYVNKLQLKYFFNNVAQAKSIFSITNSMDVINSGGILVYENGSLFINANRNSVSICRSVDYISSFAKMYGYNSITHNIENVLEQIKAWNTFNSQNSIYSHTIIFPYHITLGHWRLGVLELNFDKTLGLIETRVNVYNPLTNYSNQQMVDSVKKDVQDSINKIFKTNIELIIRDIVTYQQQDSSSCGVISAENGKDIIDGKQERIYKIYSPDTSNLRFQHLSEVDDIYFNKMQLVPVKWQIPTLISPDVILEIQNLCMQELLKGNHFSLNVALAKLDKVNDVKKKAELFHEILEKNKYLFEEIAIRELKYQFYYDDSSSEDEESSGFDSYNYYQIENGVSDAYHSISEYTAESNTKALSERDIELSFITHEIGIRVIKSPEVGEKYFPLKHKYLGSNIIPEKIS